MSVGMESKAYFNRRSGVTGRLTAALRHVLGGIAVLALWCAHPALGQLTEKGLSGYNASFLSRAIEDNRGDEERIRRCLNGYLLEGNRGSRLIDRFGMFLARMEAKGVELRRVRFFSRNDLFSFRLIMRDAGDGQVYTLYLEYECGPGGRCRLDDISFALSFEEGMKEARVFFEAR